MFDICINLSITKINKQKTQLEKLLSQNTRHISRFFLLELHFKEPFIFIHTSFHEYRITYHTPNTSPINNYNLYLTYNLPQPLTHISDHITPLTIPKQNHTTTQSISSPNYNNNIEPLISNYIYHILIIIETPPTFEQSNPMTFGQLNHILATKHSTRNKHPLSYLKFYMCILLINALNQSSSRMNYPLSNYMSYSSLSPSFNHFVMSISILYKPNRYVKAIKFECWNQ